MLIEELLNRTRLEKLLRDSYGNYCVQVSEIGLGTTMFFVQPAQTALDYAEPGQRALLVEGIRPVLPLIRNTPYGKRIQNKLQREQMDHFTGYHSQALVLNNQSMGHGHGHGHGHGGHGHHGGGRHVPQGHHQANHLGDVYVGQYGGTGQGNNFGQTAVHGIQAQAIDGYVLQGNSNHGQTAAHGGASGFSGVQTFTNVNQFGGAGLAGDPYQRSFGYGI